MIKCINIDSTANVGGCDHFQREDCDGPVFAVNVLCGENRCDEYDECMVIVLEVRGGMSGDGVCGGDESGSVCVYVYMLNGGGVDGRVCDGMDGVSSRRIVFAANVLCGENWRHKYDECMVIVLVVRGAVSCDGACVCVCVYVCVDESRSVRVHVRVCEMGKMWAAPC